METLPLTEIKPSRRALDDRSVEMEVSLPGILSTLLQEKKRMAWPVLCAAFVGECHCFHHSGKVHRRSRHSDSTAAAVFSLDDGSASRGSQSCRTKLALGSRYTQFHRSFTLEFLKAERLQTRSIRRFKLKQVYKLKEFQLARKRLAQNTTVKAGKDTLIHIKVEDRDPNRAARLANAYVEELSLRNANVALTEASQRRMFFEKQLAKEKDLLADAEVKLRDTEQVTGLVVPSGQAEALIRSAAQLRAEILSKQAQLAGMQTFVADENPRFKAIKRELATLQSELSSHRARRACSRLARGARRKDSSGRTGIHPQIS